jgi:polysaccharide export outer membrane protein
MRKWLVFLLTLVLSLPLMAEEAVQQVLGAANEQQASSQQANPQVHENLDDYFLGTGDRIEIIVYGEPDMSM